MSDIAPALGADLLETVRRARREFQSSVEPLRPSLYRYCRRLTGNVWDAEDLVQETLMRAFARASQSHVEVENPMGWLVRIATNAYIDGWRRPAPMPTEVGDKAVTELVDGLEVRDALGDVAALLPPQERAAVVLKDVFDLPLAEIAAMLNTTVGAVKAALHRGRAKLADQDSAADRPRPSRAVLDAMADAFSSYDLDRLAALFLADAQCEVLNMVYEVGRETIRNGSLHHTLVLETDVRYRAQVVSFAGEDVVVLWQRPATAAAPPPIGLPPIGLPPVGMQSIGTAFLPAPEVIGDVIRVDTADGGISRMRVYYFCPEALAEFAETLNLPVQTHGYHL